VAEDAKTQVWMVGVVIVHDGEVKEGGDEGEERLEFEAEG